MRCPTCGPSPRVIIVDGVSLGTHSSKLTSVIRPPTVTDALSENITSISSYRARFLPAIPEKAIQVMILKFLETNSTVKLIQMDASGGYQFCTAATYPALTNLLMLYMQAGSLSRHHKPYKTLIRQIAAPDIVLQLVPYDAI